jgi:intein/homing endonuclease
MTENGNVPIKELVGKEGMVWSFNTETKKPELKPFHDCRLTQEKAEIYEIETEDGRIIKCTGEHPILTERGYVMAKNLTDTDRIISIY